MKKRILVWAAVVALGGCTLDNQTPPPLAGPSTFGLAVNVTATPDILTQDGVSASTVDVVVRDANNQPVRSQTLRLDIEVGGTPVQYGTLSSTTVSTDSGGHASVAYTTPPPPPATAPDSTVVSIAATPVGSNFQNAGFQASAAIKLVRPGAPLGPPPTLKPTFTFSPTQPTAGASIQFDASSSSTDGAAVTYSWNFGDGGGGSGVRTTHAFSVAGTYVVVLTITDSRGNSQTSDPVNVSVTSTDPTAQFAISPTNPVVGFPVFFDASGSKAATGHTIVSYDWDFGDGSLHASGMNVAHTYGTTFNYTVTLTVTDDAGHTGVLSVAVNVK